MLSRIVPNAQIIPELLDIGRFNAALSKALSSFPLLAGRLVRPDSLEAPWRIRLTNSGVPVSLVDSDADEIAPTDSVALTTLHLLESPDVSRIVNAKGESDEPLFRLTITRFTKLNTTSIGACSSHVLFDASGFLLFLKLLSQLYQGLEPIDPPPYYEPEAIKFPKPQQAPSSTSTYDPYDPSAPPPWENPEGKKMDFVALRLTAKQLSELHSSIVKDADHLRISRADTVVGLLARCLSEVEPESKPIDMISYVINHRGMGVYPQNAAVNAIFMLPTLFKVPEELDAHDSVLAWGTEIRKTLGRLKYPEFVDAVAAGVGNALSLIAWYKGGRDLSTAKEGSLIVNNMWKFGLTGAHFGHPGKVGFHHGHLPGSRYVKIATPNPKLVDGVWKSREGDMEVTFYVPPNRRKRFEKLFEGYARDLGVTGPVEFLR